MKKILTALLLLVGYVATAQYNPANFTVSNKSYGAAQAVSTDARSWFYDATNFVMRDYQSTTEVNTYLNLPKYRSGHFPIFVHSGGTLTGGGVWIGGATLVYWYKDSTGSANLVRWYTDSTITSGFLLAANNLSDLQSITTAKTNLVLNNVDNTSDATKNAASVTLTNHTISGSANTLTNIGNGSLTNSTVGLSLDATGSDVAVTGSPAALGAVNALHVPSASVSNRGVLTSADWIRFQAKVDSTQDRNDSIFDWHNGTNTFRYKITTSGTNWSILGNAGIIDASNFLGTTTDVALNFRVNNLMSGRIGHSDFNTMFGYSSGVALTSGTQNTMMGGFSGTNITTGSQNTSMGAFSLQAVSSGGFNTAIGRSSLLSVSTGSTNCALGANSLSGTTTGGDNMAIGTFAGASNTTGNFNTYVGSNAGQSFTTGSNNTIIGHYVFNSLPANSGSNNTFIGASITPPSTSANGYVIIADGSGTNRLFFDPSGNGGIGTSTPIYPLDVNGRAIIRDTLRLGNVPTGSGSDSVAVIRNGAIFKVLQSTITGATAVGAFGSSPNAQGGTITSGTLVLQPANLTNPGGVSIASQTFGGQKTFGGQLVANGGAGSGTNHIMITGALSGSPQGGGSTGLYVQSYTYTDNTSTTGSISGTQNSNVIEIPTLAASNAGITYTGVASTFRVNGAPVAGTNVTINDPWSVYIASGNINLGGHTSVGTGSAPTAWLHLAAGTSSASTAPLKFTAGTNLSATEAGAMEYDGNRLYLTNNTGRGIIQNNISVVSSAASLALSIGVTDYIFSGSTTTWTLPTLAGNTNHRFFIKNRGSGNITLNSNAGGSDIYNTGAVTTLAITPGAAFMVFNDGTFWNIE